jgi:hypothetical protein
MGNFDYPAHDDTIQDLHEAAVPVSPAAPTAPVKTVEKWAEAKGMWPQTFAAPTYGLPGGPAQGGSIAISMASLTGPKHNPEYWRFAAARAACGWPEGKEMTEAEFDAAIKAAGEHVGR